MTEASPAPSPRVCAGSWSAKGEGPLGRFGLAGEQPKQVGEPVEVSEEQGPYRVVLFDESDESAFGAASSDTGLVVGDCQCVGPGARPAVEDEPARFEFGDLRVEPAEVVIGEFLELRVFVAGDCIRRAGDLAHESDECLLNRIESHVGGVTRVGRLVAVCCIGDRWMGAGGELGCADCDVELVECADGFNLRVRFGDALAVKEAGGAAVPAARGD